MRLALHIARRAPHVHDDQPGLSLRNHLRHARIKGQAADVIDHTHAFSQRLPGDTGLVGVHRQGNSGLPAELADDRQHPPRLFGLIHRQRAGTCGFAADIEKIAPPRSGAALLHSPIDRGYRPPSLNESGVTLRMPMIKV